MSVRLILFFAIGRLVIFFLQKVFQDNFKEKVTPEGFIDKLFSCDLCLGFWVYFLLGFVFKIQFVYVITYIPIISEILTGMAMSFMMHIFRLGWNSKFQIVEMK